MKLLLTNDDGVFAPGLITLASNLAAEGHEVWVVAPDRERSSIGHAITLFKPLRLWNIESGVYPNNVKVWACDGTPSDCVVLGIEEILPEADAVVSGINRGPNLGDDLTYSGTVSAAMEAHFLGKPAVAVSLCCEANENGHLYDTAAKAVIAILNKFCDIGFYDSLLLNVNVPNLPIKAIKGFSVTKKGIRMYEEKVTKLNDSKGNVYYWISGRIEDKLEDGADVKAVKDGFVSITPIHMDLTHYPSIDKLKRAGLEEIKIQF
ncbi:5'/3'-nucleotidase SurE [Thermovirga lienii]|uniref:5'/3'-nucleotidase SurE n=1 Tax=Thermovirga lienii TaxID=336261 RepID=UPI000EB89E62|nr:5'/3'-nucleotidase SurE [Thermovirga lienii]